MSGCPVYRRVVPSDEAIRRISDYRQKWPTHLNLENDSASESSDTETLVQFPTCLEHSNSKEQVTTIPSGKDVCGVNHVPQ